MGDLAFMQSYKQLFEEYMKKELACYQKGYHYRLAEAMAYSLLAGGKRLRPILCLCACEACGTKKEEALPAALALEAIHTYSLIHDDLPGMDNDDLRRGNPTNHKVFGEAMAILAGDGLQSMAYEVLSNYGAKEPEKALAMITELSKRAGSGGMCAGQAADIMAENEEVDAEKLNYIHNHKTGDLIIGALIMGAIAAGSDEKQRKALAEYGYHLGLAFQITDDILDVTGDEAKLGKPVGSDDKNHKLTFPALYGLAEARKMAEQSVAKAKEAIAALADNDNLLALAEYLLEREN